MSQCKHQLREAACLSWQRASSLENFQLPCSCNARHATAAALVHVWPFGCCGACISVNDEFLLFHHLSSSAWRMLRSAARASCPR
jgi:hypothetical protein